MELTFLFKVFFNFSKHLNEFLHDFAIFEQILGEAFEELLFDKEYRDEEELLSLCSKTRAYSGVKEN